MSSPAISVIPGETTFTVDMRSLSIDTCERFHELLLKEADAVAKERGVKFEFDRKIVTDAAKVDAALSDRIEAAAKSAGIPVRRLASGAGHDAAVIGNQNGSHNPYEAMKMEDFMKGVNVLWHTVRDYDA